MVSNQIYLNLLSLVFQGSSGELLEENIKLLDWALTREAVSSPSCKYVSVGSRIVSFMFIVSCVILHIYVWAQDRGDSDKFFSERNWSWSERMLEPDLRPT